MLQNAVSASSPAVAQEIGDRKDALDAARTTLAGSWVTTKTKPARDRANAHAEKDFLVAEGVLNTFLYRLNAYSIAQIRLLSKATSLHACCSCSRIILEICSRFPAALCGPTWPSLPRSEEHTSELQSL